MIFVNKNLTDIAEGYQKILETEGQLVAKWQRPLMEVYAHQQSRYTRKKANHRRRMKSMGLWMPVGLGLAGLTFFAGLGASWGSNVVNNNGLEALLAPVGSALMPVAILLGIGLAIIWAGMAFLFQPRSPQHPLKSPLKEKLFPSLFPAWQAQLRQSLPAAVEEHGDRGENEFIRRLARQLDDTYFVVNKLQQNPNEDIDVAVIGPSGIWVFEVKYWSGEIIWQNGHWERNQSHYAPGGILVEEPGKVSQPPDKQWRRVAGQVLQTLQKRMRRVIFSIPDLAEHQGGIVFTHPKATYDIAGQAPFAWGTIAHWQQWLKSAPPIAGLNEDKRIRILSALLARHQQLNRERSQISMVAYADRLRDNAEARLKQWVSKRKVSPPVKNRG